MRPSLRYPRRAGILGPALAAFLLILLITAVPALATFAGANGRIVFESERDTPGYPEIYTMNPDGSDQVRLTNNTVIDDLPGWSPDGTKIVFVSRRDGNSEIYSMNADGSAQTRLTNNSAHDEDPAWSPDGTRIVFQSLRDGIEELYVMNADGSNQTRITNNAAADYAPAWSPGGTRIAFVTDRDGYPEIYTMNVDGTGETRLTNNDAIDEQPNWSPDGTKIAFMSERDGNFEVYKMNADGSAQTRLVGSSTRDEDPAWSPDGTTIVFQSLRDGNEEIYTMNPDGTNQTNRMNNPAVDAVPEWQPLPGSSPLPSYQVPKRTAPLRFSLVPVFQQCGTGARPANGHHASPFSVPSCTPALAQGVAHFGAQSRGDAWVSVIYGDTSTTNGDQADLSLRFDLSDIRTAGGADYDPSPSADGRLQVRLRFTDRLNGVAGTSEGTATDTDFGVAFNCTATADSATGSDCRLDTSVDAITPGLIRENQATVLQLFRLRLMDSGPDDTAGNSDDRLFATQGFYVP